MKSKNLRVPKNYKQPFIAEAAPFILMIAIIAIPIAFYMGSLSISWIELVLIIFGLFVVLGMQDSLFGKYEAWAQRSKESFFKKYKVK
tara:strand:+ start:1658 stop:1921 length:264 start_codon:yes stop_codon:yes gene_type:complete